MPRSRVISGAARGVNLSARSPSRDSRQRPHDQYPIVEGRSSDPRAGRKFNNFPPKRPETEKSFCASSGVIFHGRARTARAAKRAAEELML